MSRTLPTPDTCPCMPHRCHRAGVPAPWGQKLLGPQGSERVPGLARIHATWGATGCGVEDVHAETGHATAEGRGCAHEVPQGAGSAISTQAKCLTSAPRQMGWESWEHL